MPSSALRAHPSGNDAIRIAVLSDLHLEVRKRHLVRDGLSEDEARDRLRRAVDEAVVSARDADLVVLAGDVMNGTAGVAWAERVFAAQQVVYVAGNHEFFGHSMPGLLPLLADAAGGTTNVAFLEKGVLRLDVRGRALRVLGCVLWTDYALYGAEEAGAAMALATGRILDHERIALDGGGPLSADDVRDLHRDSRAWLEETLGAPFEGTTVVVTHHAPSPRSIAPRFAGDPLSPSFASDLGGLIERTAPALWVHGHTHHDVDYRIGETRVVSNQWGYPREGLPMTTALVEV